jgi:hypothetical protein
MSEPQPGSSSGSRPATFTIKIKTMQPAVHEVEVNPNMTIIQLKDIIEPKVNLVPARQRLIFKGRALQDTQTLLEAGPWQLRVSCNNAHATLTAFDVQDWRLATPCTWWRGLQTRHHRHQVCLLSTPRSSQAQQQPICVLQSLPRQPAQHPDPHLDLSTSAG